MMFKRDKLDVNLPRGYKPHSADLAERLRDFGTREGIGHVEIVARGVVHLAEVAPAEPVSEPPTTQPNSFEGAQ